MNTRFLIGLSAALLLIGGIVGGYFAFGGSSKKETNVPIEWRDPILETAKTRGVIDGYRLVELHAAQNITYITSDQNVTLSYTGGCPGGASCPEGLQRVLSILYRANARSREEVQAISRIARARGMRTNAVPFTEG
jgi:hypothetical protein